MSKIMAWGLAGLLLAQSASHAAPVAARQRILMDANWRFQRGDPAEYNMLGAGNRITQWRWQADTRGEAAASELAAPGLNTQGNEWKDATPGQDVFGGRRGFAWFRATLPAVPAARDQAPHILHFEGVDDNATIYFNGKRLLRHNGWGEAFDVPLDTAWQAGVPNEVAVLVENTAGAGGVGPAAVQIGAAPPVTIATLNYNDRNWRSVHLPHDFVVEGTFDRRADASHGFLPGDVGWYRKTFTLPSADRGKRLWLDFDGIYRNSKIWLNGRLLGQHPGGYTSFRFDITDTANYGGRNVLTVRADARSFEGWWYEGGGIYRHVWLNVADPLHVTPWGTFVTSDVQGNGANVQVKTEVANQSNASATFRLVSQVQNAEGVTVATVATDHTLAAGQSQEFSQQAPVSNPRLWSIETPYMYRLVTQVQRRQRTVDTVTTPFGIRTIRFDAEQGFFLNGKPVKLKGTCNHQDFAGIGTAMPDHVLYWRIRKLKEMGSNACRMSHNPPSPELIDACDRLGMVVMDENRHLGDTFNGKTPSGTPYEDLSELAAMVKRDRNHPSIIMWSMCNEEPLQGSDEGARIFKAMKTATDKWDGTRPVTAAMNGGWGSGFSLVEDLQGGNYNPNGYDGYHKAHPNHPLYGSETASTVSTRGIYANDKVRGYVSAYDVNFPGWAQTAEDAWRPIAQRPYVAGGFVWTGFDYRGEPTPYSWPCINSHFGIMDMCGFPKDNYYYYQAWWGDKPLVHILPHWNWTGKEGQDIDVWCHSNCDRVELLLNGKSLGSRDMPRYGHVEWKVPYALGRLEARGYNGTTLATSDVVETTGAPAQLLLTPDRTTMQADGEDMILVKVVVADAQGRVVPIADNQVTFQVTGAAHVGGVANGDPSSHEPDKASQRHAFNGLCMVVLQAKERGGNVQLAATSPGLRGVSVRLRSTEAAVAP
ncbi:MAG: DUF4982 domain-containing protein [Abitibacteriaceae bacterium]|nr:DUF4982 domain-containing protein [Abditibacteriaceae bacterium]